MVSQLYFQFRREKKMCFHEYKQVLQHSSPIVSHAKGASYMKSQFFHSFRHSLSPYFFSHLWNQRGSSWRRPASSRLGRLRARERHDRRKRNFIVCWFLPNALNTFCFKLAFIEKLRCDLWYVAVSLSRIRNHKHFFSLLDNKKWGKYRNKL